MLVAGQTGAGKTQFLRQFIATVLSHHRDSFVALIDMKGGIDFQSFLDVPNFKLVSKYSDADTLLSEVIALFETRKEYLLSKRKTNWSELSLKELVREQSMDGLPIGPVVIVVDELAELSKKASERASKSLIQDKLATLARLARFAGIHLVLGTQRPDKSTLDMQSKDNIPTRVCFSVPSVTASTLVVGDMSASTLGNIPGRAIFQLSGSKVIQSPLIENKELKEMMDKHSSRLRDQNYDRGLGQDQRKPLGVLTRGPKL
jgi:S-DNA-T family DNA segregation ATPase FtsK/SpoIIIE